MNKDEAYSVIKRCALERMDDNIIDYLIFPETFELAKAVLGDFEALDFYHEELDRLRAEKSGVEL